MDLHEHPALAGITKKHRAAVFLHRNLRKSAEHCFIQILHRGAFTSSLGRRSSQNQHIELDRLVNYGIHKNLLGQTCSEDNSTHKINVKTSIPDVNAQVGYTPLFSQDDGLEFKGLPLNLDSMKFLKIEGFKIADSRSGATLTLPEAVLVHCSLTISTVLALESTGNPKLEFGYELGRDSKAGTLQADHGSSRYNGPITRVIFQSQFEFAVKELLEHQALPGSHLGELKHNSARNTIAEKYGLIILFELVAGEAKWPLAGLIGGHELGKLLKRENFGQDMIRLRCEGWISPDIDQKSFRLHLESGDILQKTRCVLELKTMWSASQCSPKSSASALDECSLPSTTAADSIQICEEGMPRALLPKPEKLLSKACSRSPKRFKKSHCRSRSRAESEMAYNHFTPEAASPLQRIPLPPSPSSPPPPSRPPILIPQANNQLFHHLTKQQFRKGDVFTTPDSNIDQSWRISKLADKIKLDPSISESAKEYIIHWNEFIMPWEITTSAYLPKALKHFVESNKDWFGQKESRVREFTTHATVLRLRGVIDWAFIGKYGRRLRYYRHEWEANEAAKRSRETREQEEKQKGQETGENKEAEQESDESPVSASRRIRRRDKGKSKQKESKQELLGPTTRGFSNCVCGRYVEPYNAVICYTPECPARYYHRSCINEKTPAHYWKCQFCR